MAKTFTYRELMPFFEEQLAKLTPEQRHAVAQGLKNPRTGWGSTPQWDAGVDALMQQLKIDQNAAESMIANIHAAQRLGPDAQYQDPNQAMPFDGPLKARSAYASDEEYEAAFKEAMGWGSLTQKPEEIAAAKEAAVEDAGRNSTRSRILEFAREMLGPVDANDPVYAQLVQSGTDAAQASAGVAGLSGRSGLAGTQAASVAQQNVTPYLAQRKSMGLGALSTAGNLDLNYAQLAQADAQYAQNRADLMAGESWKAGQAGAQGLGGTIGAVGGGILGAYFGGPQGAAMGAQAGAGLGSSLATMGQPSGPTYSTYTPKQYKPPKPSGSGGAGF